MLISLDTEDTGVDTKHGAKPYFVTTCNETGEQTFWEWPVNPLGRQPQIPATDLVEIQDLLHGDFISPVLQNAKFDAAALAAIGIDSWPWTRTWDTLIAGHLLASNQPHDLTSMALIYLGVNIQPYEDALERACNEARRIARSKYPTWRIAKKDLPEMPSAKDRVWKYDAWLPRAIALEEDYPTDHPWWTVLADYGNADSAVTLPLFLAQKAELERLGLWLIYLERLKLLPIVYGMENRGITFSSTRLAVIKQKYQEESDRAGRVCKAIAQGLDFDLTLPKSGNNKSLLTFCFDKLQLPVLEKSAKTGAPSLNKVVLEQYELTLPNRSRQLTFIKALRGKRKRDTAITYMTSYERYAVACLDDFYRVHSNLNPTATDTLRWGSSNPNEQNVSKQESECQRCQGEGCEHCDDTGQDLFSLRKIFGPLPGYEWWAFDYENLERRIPAYEANERVLIDLFERPNEPPYFGSEHLLNASIVYPDLFWPIAEEKGAFKRRYASTWYQWIKNFGFAVGYGAMLGSGTADRAAHKPGAQALIAGQLKEYAKLNQKYIDIGNKQGYVETIPDKTVDPKRGYPIRCTRSKWGSISPTIPLNYHVQSTAMWCTMKAMIRVEQYLASIGEGAITLQIHDELVIELPARGKQNLAKVAKIKQLMEQSGDDIGVPLAVSASYHPNNWAEAIVL